MSNINADFIRQAAEQRISRHKQVQQHNQNDFIGSKSSNTTANCASIATPATSPLAKISSTVGKHRKIRRESILAMLDNKENVTPNAARLANIDYKINGDRALVNDGAFIRPRWIPGNVKIYLRNIIIKHLS